ncbi:hypothetical protein [Deinococcus aquatilis]|uniref:hypothetical protein n=1 Tax=Deinococcus aquatilis TaxID=519440 RepID=UPI000369142E|nr:hypothetical protein [Deinococcus aquatilis]
MNRNTAFLLGALLLSGAGAQDAAPVSTPPADTSAAPATDLPVTQNILALTPAVLTIDLPERVQEVLISLPAASLAEPTLRINGTDVSGTAQDTQVLFRVRTPARVLNITFTGQVSSAADIGVAVLYDTQLTETLSGTLKFKASGALTAESSLTREGVIRTPVSGNVQRGRSSTNVTTVSGLDEPFTLLVNGAAVPDTLVGRRVDDPNTNLTTREFIGVPLQPGRNVLTAVTPAGEDEVTLQVAGPAAGVQITEQQLIADGFSPLSLTLDVTDVDGRPTVLPTITVEDAGRLTLATPDADPSQAGHQIAAVNGVATLRFAPQSTPLTTVLKLDVNNHAVTLPVNVQPARKRTVIAMASATVSGLGSEYEVSGALRATVEAPILDGQLTVHADSGGAHTDTPAETRNPSLGDRSRESRPLEADGPIAARFDHPSLTATYTRNAAVDPVFGQADSGDALNVITTGDTRVSAYVAPFAGNSQDFDVPLTGTRLARLPAQLDPGRAQLFLRTTTDGVTTTVELVSGRDYAIDETGLITFNRPLLNNPDLNVSVQLIARGPVQSGVLTPGAQLAVTRQFQTGEAASSLSAGVHADAQGLTYGVRYLAVDTRGSGTYNVDARAAVSGTGSQAQVIARGKQDQTSWAVTGQHETAGYAGQGAISTAGQTLTASVQRPLNDRFGVRAETRLRNDAQGFGGRVSAEGVYSPNDQSQYSAGLFTGFGTLDGTGVSGSARWKAGPWSTVLTAQQQLTSPTGSYSAQVTRRVPLPERLGTSSELAFGVKATATLASGAFSYRAGAVINGRSGPYTASLEYGLPTTPDSVGEIRGSVQATFPVTQNLNVGGALLVTPDTQSLSADARYTTPATVATLGADLTHAEDNGFSSSVKFSVSHTLRADQTPFGVTADGLSTFSAKGSGHRYSAGLTYRGEDWNTAAYLRYRAGLLTSTLTGQELTGELNSTYHTPRWQTRFGLAAQARPNDAQSLTLQGLFASRYWLTENAAVGVAYRGLYAPAQQSFAHSFGVEGTYKVYDTAAVSLGYNFGGFDSLTAEPTRSGLYVRLDVLLDDTRRNTR